MGRGFFARTEISPMLGKPRKCDGLVFAEICVESTRVKKMLWIAIRMIRLECEDGAFGLWILCGAFGLFVWTVGAS
jgi:hypothetical protein